MENLDQSKLAEWLQIFYRHIRERTITLHVKEDEGYKFEAVQQFQANFDIDAEDLRSMLDASLANNNLVSGAMYFPKKMLLIYAESFPEETRAILRQLFNNSDDVAFRIDQTKQAFEDLEQRRDDPTNKSFNTYIGLRFLSLLLSFYDPQNYNALKPAEWKVFCRFVNPEFAMPNHTPAGEQYKIYNDYIEALRVYLSQRPEIERLREDLTKGLTFKDEALRWVTQDVIFVTARVYAHNRSAETNEFNQAPEKTIEPEDDSDNEQNEYNTGFMAYEQHLEEYVIKNWDNIDFGEELQMYVDEEGTTGQQFTTDVGIMDILATDKKGGYVVIELKRAESGYKVVGQVLNYMGWVQDKLAIEGQSVRGLIVVGRADKTLRAAIRPIADKVGLREYHIKMKLTEPSDSN